MIVGRVIELLKSVETLRQRRSYPGRVVVSHRSVIEKQLMTVIVGEAGDLLYSHILLQLRVRGNR